MAGKNKKPWEQSFGRRPAGTRERRRVLILCEDSKSSCDYFKSFKIDPKRADVVALGIGMNTDSLNAFRKFKLAGNRGEDATPLG
jgi:hypothetical protein